MWLRLHISATCRQITTEYKTFSVSLWCFLLHHQSQSVHLHVRQLFCSPVKSQILPLTPVWFRVFLLSCHGQSVTTAQRLPWWWVSLNELPFKLAKWWRRKHKKFLAGITMKHYDWDNQASHSDDLSPCFSLDNYHFDVVENKRLYMQNEMAGLNSVSQWWARFCVQLMLNT